MLPDRASALVEAISWVDGSLHPEGRKKPITEVLHRIHNRHSYHMRIQRSNNFSRICVSLSSLDSVESLDLETLFTVHLPNAKVKFVYQGHWVKLKVTWELLNTLIQACECSAFDWKTLLLSLARGTMLSLEPIVTLYCCDVRPSGTGMHCDHMVYFSAGVVDSPMFCTPWHLSMSTYSQPFFPVPPGREVGYRCAN